MKAEEIREGDIVEIDYISKFTKEHINEGKALVIWKGFNHQPLVRKLNTKTIGWSCYEYIARVVGHIDIEGYMDKALIIPENPTNGDMIKAMFNPYKICKYEFNVHIYMTERDFEESDYQMNYDRRWWNALYNAESEG